MLRHDTSIRMRGLIAASAAAVLTTGLIASSATADPEVSADDVRAAYAELSKVNEKVNAISADLEETQDEISDLEGEIDDQMAEYNRQRDVLGQSVVQQQMDSPLGASVSVLGSEDPEAFLDAIGAQLALDTTRAQELGAFQEVAREMENRRTAMKDRKAELSADRKELDKTLADRKAKHEETEAQFAELESEQQAEVTGASATDEADVELGDVDASGRAGKAIEFARAQLGDAYVYGGTGPDGWDCSGLMQGAYAAAGASIPRVAGAQFSAGQEVSMGSLQPGDLVFYGDMSHVAMFVGNGQVIEAANSSSPVRVASMIPRFTKAARIG
ncbi:NlpC/P60 family protein [Aeromicrobium sp. CF4.19]|uniref:C40 family peptidase n=1 Tax=Aeromicrobium sp. CF4.19 TaxID=3373082 RepID=UPI003EE4AE42